MMPFYHLPPPFPAPAWHPAAHIPPPPPPPPPPFMFGIPVCQVTAHNFDYEVRGGSLGHLAPRARYVAVTVHYPGVVHGADQDHNLLTPEQRYALVKANVDALKPLQVGIAVCTVDGQIAAWEFSLNEFDPAVDHYAPNSVAYLKSRGLDVDVNRREGISMANLGMALRSLGLFTRTDLTWITYSGAYHIGYLMKLVAGGERLPADMAGFFVMVRRYIGSNVYDVARMAGDCQDMPVGLERIAARLRLAPPLCSTQLAGGSCVLALQAFMALGRGNVSVYRGVLKGLQVI